MQDIHHNNYKQQLLILSKQQQTLIYMTLPLVQTLATSLILEPLLFKLLLVVDTNVLLRPSSLDALKLVCRLFGPGASTEARRGAGRGGAAGADVEVAGLLTITVMKELDRLKVRGPGPGQVWR